MGVIFGSFQKMEDFIHSCEKYQIDQKMNCFKKLTFRDYILTNTGN